MVSLTSKQSSLIAFKATPIETITIDPPLTMVIETGVAVINFGGTNPNDWTRDTLAFPVGEPCAANLYLSGIAAASPCSFYMPLAKDTSTGNYQASVSVSGADSSGNVLFLSGTADVVETVSPPIGCAVDSAIVTYSAAQGQPLLTLAVAVFGQASFLVRISYTAYVAMAEHRTIVVGGAGGSTVAK
jgi:hypothetical protein